MSESLISNHLNNDQIGFKLPLIAAESNIKVSVAMITYNQESYVSQAIESVISQQTNFEFEIVISDDYSTDNTRSILQEFKIKYPNKIRLLLPDANQGMHLNFVSTLAVCQGVYIALLEGDDYWTSNQKLQKQIDFLDQNPDYSICFHKVLCHYEDNSSESYIFPNKNPTLCSSLEDLLLGNFMSTCSVVYRNRLFDKIPSWYFDLKLGDWPLHILNSEYGRIGFIDEVMGVYRIHKGGVWSMKKRTEIVENSIEALKSIDTYFKYKYNSIINFSISNWKLELFMDKSDFISTNEAISSSKVILLNPLLSKKYLSPKRYLHALFYFVLLSIKSIF
jgi:glycosyltransferase involved in cell wall biosynthesis